MRRFLEQELIQWKNQKEHLPLLLRGARQVGKSYLVEYFGREHFEKIVVVDFERRPECKRCFVSREPTEVLKQIELVLQEKIIPGTTLLFLDEIQECPEALLALRYFRELMPELHVIAAGSLMEFILNDERYSFPVGRVDFMYLRPLSFHEFLTAAAPIAAERVSQANLSTQFHEVEHEELLKWVRRYLFIGGMPFAVKSYLENHSFLESQKVHQRILQAYENDFGKYASYTQHKYLQLIFQRTPALVTKVVKYKNIDREIRSRELKPALGLLTQSGLILKVLQTTASGLPLLAYIREHQFKLLFLDVGLLQTACQVDAQDFWEKELLQINEGAIAEQFVGQELLANNSPYFNHSLLYWEREEGGQAEVDYVTTFDSKIVPIEVKAGATGTLRSLHSFMKLKNASLGLRISEQPLSLHGGILSVPLYLTCRLKSLVLEAISHLQKSESQ